MSLTVFLRPEAEADIEEAYLWYAERDPALGSDFLLAIDEAIQSVVAHPEAHSIVHRDVRRTLLRRFPYGLFYVHDDARINVIACFHASRDPKRWRSRRAG